MNSFSFVDGKEILEHFLGNSNLFFPKVQHIHSGSYICSAKVINKETSQIIKEETREIFLRVHGKYVLNFLL